MENSLTTKFNVMQNSYLIIMAGGVGSRFWPFSTKESPKQFIDVFDSGETLIQSTANRFKNIVKPENIFVVTNQEYDGLVKEQLPLIPLDNILLEPFMRNTAPCIAYAINKIFHKDKNANIIVSPADHFIANEKKFIEIIMQGLEFTENSDNLLTIGIQPTYPATGYGYINSKANGEILHEVVIEFKEKPSTEVALNYIRQGNYYWNSGLFLWNVNAIRKAMSLHLPDIQSKISKIEFYTENEKDQLEIVYKSCESISIDYGIMEKADNIFVIHGEFGWSDVGSWKSLYDLSKKDETGNVGTNKTKFIESNNNFVKSEKNVIIQGVEDLLVVESEKDLLICKLDQDQRVKEFSQYLKD